jgi:hypothetical protein
MKRMFYVVLSVLLLVSMACTINIPSKKLSTMETQTYSFKEDAPNTTGPVQMTIDMGAGNLDLQSGAKGWVEGTVRYNITDWKPQITRQEDKITIRQNNLENIGIPSRDIINDWTLKLGSMPMDLYLHAGAYDGSLDFSGLALTYLEVSDGASSVDVTFDKPNTEKMSRFIYKTGASSVFMKGLSYANFSNMQFEGGAGSYTLDFTGKLQQDADVSISTGVSDITIIIPEGTPSRITVTGGLSDVSPSGTWTVDGKTYETSGNGPSITIDVKMGIGSLKLIQK